MWRCRIKSQTKFNKNGSGTISLKIRYSGLIASQLDKNEIFNKDLGEVKKYVEGNNHIEELTFDFKDINELNDKFANNINGLKFEVAEKKGLIKMNMFVP